MDSALDKGTMVPQRQNKICELNDITYIHSNRDHNEYTSECNKLHEKWLVRTFYMKPKRSDDDAL